MLTLLVACCGLHIVCSSSEMDRFNKYKHLLVEPDLGKCHWSCPFHAERLCGYDVDQGVYKLFLNPCFLHLHNHCFDTGFETTTGLWKCHDKHGYPTKEIEYLKRVLYGLPKKRRQEEQDEMINNVKPLPRKHKRNKNMQRLLE